MSKERKIFVTSDLHIGAGYSNAKSYQTQIEDGIKSHDTTVLLGDIFEFKYNVHSLDDQLARAEKWLENLLKIAGDKEIHYVLGNHDACSGLWTLLEKISHTHPNFKIHNDHVVIGKTLFTHGDVAMLPDDMKPHGKRIHSYESLHKSGLKMAVHTVLNVPGPQGSGLYNYREPVIFNSLIKHYKSLIGEKSITDIIFGHVHRPQGIINHFHEFDGVKQYCHSTGPAVLGCKNLMLTVTQNECGSTVEVSPYSHKISALAKESCSTEGTKTL